MQIDYKKIVSSFYKMGQSKNDSLEICNIWAKFYNR